MNIDEEGVTVLRIRNHIMFIIRDTVKAQKMIDARQHKITAFIPFLDNCASPVSPFIIHFLLLSHSVNSIYIKPQLIFIYNPLISLIL